MKAIWTMGTGGGVFYLDKVAVAAVAVAAGPKTKKKTAAARELKPRGADLPAQSRRCANQPTTDVSREGSSDTRRRPHKTPSCLNASTHTHTHTHTYSTLYLYTLSNLVHTWRSTEGGPPTVCVRRLPLAKTPSEQREGGGGRPSGVNSSSD